MERNGCGHGIIKIIPQYLAGETKENHKNTISIINSVPAETKIRNLLNTNLECSCYIILAAFVLYVMSKKIIWVMKPISLLTESDLEGVCQISWVRKSSDSE